MVQDQPQVKYARNVLTIFPYGGTSQRKNVLAKGGEQLICLEEPFTPAAHE